LPEQSISLSLPARNLHSPVKCEHGITHSMFLEVQGVQMQRDFSQNSPEPAELDVVAKVALLSGICGMTAPHHHRSLDPLSTASASSRAVSSSSLVVHRLVVPCRLHTREFAIAYTAGITRRSTRVVRRRRRRRREFESRAGFVTLGRARSHRNNSTRRPEILDAVAE